MKDRNTAVRRFRKTADNIRLAIDAGDDGVKVREALTEFGVFWDLIDPPAGSSSSAVHGAIATGAGLSINPSGGLQTASDSTTSYVKASRSYGDSNGSIA